MNGELDNLLDQLRQPRPPAGLQDVERRIWLRISADDAKSRRPRMRVSLQLAAVAASFVAGLAFGVQVPVSSTKDQTHLVEEIDVLSPNAGALFY